MKDSFGELGASGMATASWRANFKWEQRSAKKMATKCVSRYQHLIFSSLYYMNDYTWSSLNCFIFQELVDMTNEVEKKGEIYFKVNFENEIEV